MVMRGREKLAMMVSRVSIPTGRQAGYLAFLVILLAGVFLEEVVKLACSLYAVFIDCIIDTRDFFSNIHNIVYLFFPPFLSPLFSPCSLTIW